MWFHERAGTGDVPLGRRADRGPAPALAACLAVLALGCRSASTPTTRTSAPPSSAEPSSSASSVVPQAQGQTAPPATASSDAKLAGPLDPTALPSLQPQPCAAVGHGKVRRVLSVSERKPLLEAARAAWDADWMAPIGCVEQVSVSCAPDLDGNPGSEVVADIRYLAGIENCAAARRRGVSSTHALLAFSPPTPDSSAWRLLGLIGYGRFDVGGVEAPATTELTGFVRLPEGGGALRVTRANDGADCSGQRSVEVLSAPEGTLTVLATKELRACNAP